MPVERPTGRTTHLPGGDISPERTTSGLTVAAYSLAGQHGDILSDRLNPDHCIQEPT
jgi:hypothetical protein